MHASPLRKIATNTERKHGFSFIVSGNDSQILRRFKPRLQMREEKSYEIGLG